MPKKESKAEIKKVESIVERMKKKYAEKGLALGEKPSKELKELRELLTSEKPPRKTIKALEQLKESKDKFLAFIGKTYFSFQKFFKPLLRFFSSLSAVKKLDYYLYSAHIKFSVAQWLVISIVSAAILSIITFFFSSITLTLFQIPIATTFLISILLTISIFLISSALILLYPKFKAFRRAEAIDAELPFALRHLATQLRAGIGLFKALQTIATSDYGVLSEELSRTVIAIEEGTETKEALSKLAYYTQSRSLKNSCAHIIRALRTGSNLSEVITSIASDVSFEHRAKMREFAEKMNFFGVIFIFIAIVLPVFIAILSAIANSPVARMFFVVLPLSPMIITLFYGLIMPFILCVLILHLKMIQPSV